MITVSVTSDSSLPELKAISSLIAELIVLREESIAKKNTLTVKLDASDVMPMVHEAIEQAKSEVFTPTELAESESLGKPVCSTVDAEASKIAPADMLETTLTPNPQIVFGQPAQTVVSEANPVAPVTESPALDADGLPWDERIHSSSKERNANGTWRKRRGVDANLVTKVEAELRGEPLAEMTHAVVIPPNDPVVVNSSEMTFMELLDAITKAMVAGQLKQVQIYEALQSLNLAALPFLMNKPELIPEFRKALGGIV